MLIFLGFVQCIIAQNETEIDTIPPNMDTLQNPLQLTPSPRPATPSFTPEKLDSIRQSLGGGIPGKDENQGNPFADRASRTSSAPENSLEYGSKDSSFTDLVELKIHLYGEAYVRYEDFEVTADYILFDLTNNEVQAFTRPNQKEKPTFTTGEQIVKAENIRYNIDSEQGIVKGARVQQNQLYIHGAVTKFVKAGQDSLHIDDVIYNKNALITTCDKDHPHWGIRTTKLKMIPDKLAVVGPFDMELGGIPTPLALPFAFAPLFSIGQSSSGIIFPQDPFYSSPRLGLGTRGLGYYFAISDRMDLALTGDVYTRGTFAINAASSYRKRYKYNGRINLSYSRELQDVANQESPNVQKAYSISINHTQDPKAHPYRTIGGSLRFTINDFDRRNYSDVNSQLNSQINSNFSYNYKINSKTNFSTSIVHSQNTQTRSISFTLPDMQLRVSRIFPFKRKSSSASNEAWYEKINMQYLGKFQNKVTTVDSLLFTKQTLDEFRFGASHELDVGASYNLLEHFSFNTNASYDEFWYFQTYEHAGVDTSGQIIGGIKRGFTPLRNLSLNANLTTNIFGTIQFAKGKLRGLRHKMTPSIGVNFTPSTQHHLRTFDPPLPTDEDLEYNPFTPENEQNLIFRKGLNRGGMSITYRLMNTFEGKLWSKKDSTEKKFKIFNSINLSGNYNLQADSLKWSEIALTANAQLFKGKSTLSINGRLDPYIENEAGRRINTTVLSQPGGKILRWEAFTASISTNLTLRDIRDMFKGDLEDENNTSSNRRQKARERDPNEPPEFFSWFENFRISHVLRLSLADTDRDGITSVETSAHSIRLTTGTIQLSDKWGMSVDNISYDLKRKQWVYPSFTLSRDLHCWQMRISWQPQLDTYTFFIGVKASPFNQYLKYEAGRNNFDRNIRFN